MAFFKVFRLPKHQRFEYSPRYWDQEKEELEKRLDIYKGEDSKDLSASAMKERISLRFRKRGGVPDARYRLKVTRNSNKLLFLILAVLVVITYLLFNEFLPELNRLMSN